MPFPSCEAFDRIPFERPPDPEPPAVPAIDPEPLPARMSLFEFLSYFFKP